MSKVQSQNGDGGTRPRTINFGRYGVIAALAAAFAHNLNVSWLKWGDLLVDAGKEFHQPAQILAGKMLYRDIAAYYGPLAPYFNALLYKVFGNHADTLRAAGIISAALMCAVIYRICRLFIGRMPAAFAAGTFLYACAFGQFMSNANYNFVVPYSYSATYGMLLAALSLFFLLRFSLKDKPRDFFLSVGLLALAALCKLEPFFAAAVAHTVFLAVRLLERKFTIRLFAPYVASGLFCAAIFGFFWMNAPEQIKAYSLAINAPSHHLLIREIMGLDAPGDSIGLVMQSAAIFATALAVMWLMASGFGKMLANAIVRSPDAICFSVTFAAVFFKLGFGGNPVNFVLRAVPLILALFLMALTIQFLKRASRRAEYLPYLLILGFALACLPRLFLRTWAAHFGFYLVPIPLAALAICWCGLLPKISGSTAVARSFAATSLVAIFMAFGVQHFGESRKAYAQHNADIVAPRGRFVAMKPFYTRTDILTATFGYISRQPAGTRILVLPQGLMLTYLSGHENPYSAFEYLQGMDEERVLAEWQAAPPDMIVEVDYKKAEPTVPKFGVDYGLKCAAWIDEHFETLIDSPDKFFMILKAKK